MKNKEFNRFIEAHKLSELDQGLLRQAFTHSSVGKINNERLEFLGDAVLDSVISEYLYLKLPSAAESYLTRLRAHLVNKEALAKIANKLSFSDYLVLGAGEKQTGGHTRDSNLADAFEAFLGSIFLASDYNEVKAFILKVYKSDFDDLPSEESLKDPKTQLQEYLQKNALSLPVYEILSEEGKPHNKTFVVRGKANGIAHEAEGKSRKQAEQKVAVLLLKTLANHKIKSQ